MTTIVYTPEELNTVIECRRIRRSSIATYSEKETARSREMIVHGDAWTRFEKLQALPNDAARTQAYREMFGTDAMTYLPQGVWRQPFSQPPDTTKPDADAPDLPQVGPKTQAPWAQSKAPEMPATPPTAAWAYGDAEKAVTTIVEAVTGKPRRKPAPAAAFAPPPAGAFTAAPANAFGKK